ncbi:MAG: DUF3237 domain-containing protein [Oxalobacteraceae bacterium]|nr:MAG: DUF3237 domain-containing protein [Oxalobacteraceae bacterium]
MITPNLNFVADISVFVGEAITVGETPAGLRRLVPILGGTIRGDRLRGIILPGGADYQIIRQDGYTHLDARYAAKTDDGDMLYIVNEGVRYGEPELMARITRGETVNPTQIYFRTSPRFETAALALDWLTRPLFVATGARYPDRVDLRLFEVC